MRGGEHFPCEIDRINDPLSHPAAHDINSNSSPALARRGDRIGWRIFAPTARALHWAKIAFEARRPIRVNCIFKERISEDAASNSCTRAARVVCSAIMREPTCRRARAQLILVERLHQIIISTGLQAFDETFFAAARGEENDVKNLVRLAHSTANLQSTLSWHHPVEHRQRRRGLRADGFHRLPTMRLSR